VTVTDAFGLRGDFRLRSIGTNGAASIAELRGGVYWSF
jgi:hypothetical protein